MCASFASPAMCASKRHTCNDITGNVIPGRALAHLWLNLQTLPALYILYGVYDVKGIINLASAWASSYATLAATFKFVYLDCLALSQLIMFSWEYKEGIPTPFIPELLAIQLMKIAFFYKLTWNNKEFHERN